MLTFILKRLPRKIAVLLRSRRERLLPYASFLLTAHRDSAHPMLFPHPKISTPSLSLSLSATLLPPPPSTRRASSSLCSLVSCSRHSNYSERAFIFNLFLEITICSELERASFEEREKTVTRRSSEKQERGRLLWKGTSVWVQKLARETNELLNFSHPYCFSASPKGSLEIVHLYWQKYSKIFNTYFFSIFKTWLIKKTCPIVKRLINWTSE